MANRVTTIFDAVDRGFGDAIRRIQTGVRQAEGATNKMKAAWSGAMAEIGRSQEAQVGLVGAGAAMMVKSVAAASDLNESVNAVRVSFGEASDAVLKLGEDSATSFGLSQTEFNGLAVQFSSFAKKVGAANGQSPAAVVKDLTTRVADFASVMNLEVNEAAQIFMSTLSGETEPIRRFGKDVSAAAVEQYALANGLIKSKSELTESIKVQARYGLLMEQTADTAGDFKNTQDGLANSTRVLKAQFKDLQATVGNEFLPQVAEVTSTITMVAGAIEKLRTSSLGASKPVRDMFTIMEMGINPIKFVNWHINEFKTRVNAVFGPANDLNDSLVDQARAALNLGDAYADLTPEVHGYDGASGRAATRMAQLEGATGDLTTAQNLVAEAISSATAEVAAQNAEVKELRDRHRRAADAVYDLHDAEADLEDAIAEANATMKDQDATQRDVRQSWENVAKSADLAAQAYVAANGATMDSEAGMRLWEESMRTTAATLSGPMRQEVIDHIARVTGIPTEVVTDFVARTDGASLQEVEAELAWLSRQRFARIDPVTGGVPRYAKGTRNHPGGLALVGEQGPELLNLPAGAAVTPAPQTKAMLADGAGSTVINIKVDVAPGADGVTAGRQIVRALEQFYRSGGRPPRTA